MTISQARDDARTESTTRRAVYDEMVRSVYERGYHATSLRQVSKAVGIQMASIYYHYPSKQHLLFEIMVQTMEDLTEAVETSIADAGADVVAQLESAIAAHIAFHTERRREAYIADSELRSLEESSRKKVTAMRDRYERFFAELLERGSREGEFEVSDAPLAVKALMAMCTEVSVWYRPGGRLTLSDIIYTYTRLFRFGVSARTGATERRGG